MNAEMNISGAILTGILPSVLIDVIIIFVPGSFFSPHMLYRNTIASPAIGRKYTIKECPERNSVANSIHRWNSEPITPQHSPVIPESTSHLKNVFNIM